MNAFLDLSEQQISAPVKAHQRAVEKRAARRVDDQKKLGGQWRAWHDERRAAMQTGAHGAAARALIEFLGGMNLRDGARLVELAKSWAITDAKSRHEVLALIDGAIIALRERNGLLPFDDPLPGEPANVFLKIRTVLA